MMSEFEFRVQGKVFGEEYHSSDSFASNPQIPKSHGFHTHLNSSVNRATSDPQSVLIADCCLLLAASPKLHL